MFGFERASPENYKNQVKSTAFLSENLLNDLDPVDIEKQKFCEEFQELQKKATNVATNPSPKNIKEFSSDLIDARADNEEACTRLGLNPSREIVNLHCIVEKYYNQMIKNQINCSARYQTAMEKLNELINYLSDKDKLNPEDEAIVANLINELNSIKLDMPMSHPGILSKNEKSGFQIKFSDTRVIEVIKREANRFYSMCESSVHQLFIFIQKLFNDLLSIFDTAKASLKNDPIRKMVDNQIPR